jgi:tripeptide aminopeptidase
VIAEDESVGKTVTSSADTGLGADDRAGCAAIVIAIENRMAFARENPTAKLPPAVATFLIQEEIGLVGARYLDRSLVGRVDQAFNFDGGTMDKIRHGAIGGERMQLTIHGHASHAGVAPEKGVNAIVIAAKAIANLESRGLMGLVDRDGKRGTSNVGVISGGEATNVVTPEVFLKIEARSHDSEFRSWIVAQIRAAFEQAASEVTDSSGRPGSVEFASQVDYEAFVLPEDHPSVRKASQLLGELGYDAVCEVANGGLDANWLFQHGIAAVTLGCGQAAIHTVDEQLLVDHYLDACRFASRVLLA